MRKTKKYYREKLRKSIRDGASVIEEVLDKYFTHKYEYKFNGKVYKYKDIKVRINCNIDFWNCKITGFNKSSNPKKYPGVFVDIYWQGDSTDGDTCITLNELLRVSDEFTIPSSEDHGTLRIKKEWLKLAFEEVTNELEKEN